MNTKNQPLMTLSPFHAGEQLLQKQMGVREKMEQFGRKVIRNYLPEQHQDFYHHLPYIIIGHADDQGWPWASMILGKPGFLHSPDPQHLDIHAAPVEFDPLQKALKPGVHFGLLGIDLSNRRRNRMAAHITETSNGSVKLRVDQSFGNCPQYIQTRTFSKLSTNHQPAETQTINQLDQQTRAFIEQSDTFFVASFVPALEGEASRGADVSHRGGLPGFIRVDDEYRMTIPDYPGNHHFNTLGNFIENPKAGLLFVDFEQGHLLMLTGRVDILNDVPDQEYFDGAERFWTFTLEQGRWLKHVLPLRWYFGEYSPNSLLTGNWTQASAARKAESLRNQWIDYQVVRIHQESLHVKSFYLQPPAEIRPIFKPGQFLTVKAKIDQHELTRTYTVSSAPADKLLRISVKHEQGSDEVPAGLFSSNLHQTVALNTILKAKAPQGEFVLTDNMQKPVLLLSAGIGITPMVAMARHIYQQGLRTRAIRPVLFIHSARSAEERAFYDEINKLAELHPSFNTVWALSRPEAHLSLGREYDIQGRIDMSLLQSCLPSTELDVFLCGPAGFMQNQYDALRKLGVADHNIFAESFGPSSLQREKTTDHVPVFNEATRAIVTFQPNHTELSWTSKDGSLLEFAEVHGLNPSFGCRQGQCGQCKARLVKGRVSYRTPINSNLINKEEVLLCCAVPAEDPSKKVADIRIEFQP